MQPEWMNRVAPVVFTTWAMRGLNDLILRQRGVDAILLPSLMLLLFGGMTLAIGLRLFRVRYSAR
jgi:ABC-type multidrug transport system permease subunit